VGQSGFIKIYNYETKLAAFTFSTNQVVVNAFFSSSGDHFFFTNQNKILMYDSKSFAPFKTFQSKFTVQKFCISKNEEYIAGSCQNAEICIFSLNDAQEIDSFKPFPNSTTPPIALIFSPDSDSKLLSFSNEIEIVERDFKDKTDLQIIPPQQYKEGEKALNLTTAPSEDEFSFFRAQKNVVYYFEGLSSSSSINTYPITTQNLIKAIVYSPNSEYFCAADNKNIFVYSCSDHLCKAK